MTSAAATSSAETTSVDVSQYDYLGGQDKFCDHYRDIRYLRILQKLKRFFFEDLDGSVSNTHSARYDLKKFVNEILEDDEINDAYDALCECFSCIYENDFETALTEELAILNDHKRLSVEEK